MKLIKNQRSDITRSLVNQPLSTLVGWEKLNSIMLLDRYDESVAVETFRVADYKDNQLVGFRGNTVYVYENWLKLTNLITK